MEQILQSDSEDDNLDVDLYISDGSENSESEADPVELEEDQTLSTDISEPGLDLGLGREAEGRLI